MDGSRFDDLTKALAVGTPRSRRRVLKSLLGGAGAGALSLVGFAAGRGQSWPSRRRHLYSQRALCLWPVRSPDPAVYLPGGTTACGGTCVSTACPAGATLSNASCQCLHGDGAAAVRDRGGGRLLR